MIRRRKKVLGAWGHNSILVGDYPVGILSYSLDGFCIFPPSFL